MALPCWRAARQLLPATAALGCLASGRRRRASPDVGLHPPSWPAAQCSVAGSSACAPWGSDNKAETKKRILVIGASGYVGHFLLRGLAEVGEVVGVSRSTSPLALDHTDPAACAALLQQVRPHAVVHAAALSSPADCEREPSRAWQVNASSSIIDAVAAFDPSVRFVLLSTDQVLSGKDHLVDEAHPAEPINVYGRTKLAMEQLVESKLPQHAVLRLSFVYGPPVEGAHGTFLQFALDKLRSGTEFTAFTDQVRSAVYVDDVVEAVRLAVEGKLAGRVNVGGPVALSRSGFCRVVAERCGLSPAGMREALSTAAVGSVPSPADISMDTSKLAEAFGRQPTSLEEALTAMQLAEPPASVAKL